MKLIVDEYLNHAGKLVVGIRENSLASAYKYTLTREEATALRDELTRALENEFGDFSPSYSFKDEGR